MITSLLDDYYQVHWKKPLPKAGTARAAIKMTAKNHCSFGILAIS
jgi:hypothetical protein